MSKATMPLYMNIYKSNVKGREFKGSEIFDTKKLADRWHKNFNNQERIACIPINIIVDTFDGEFIKFTDEV